MSDAIKAEKAGDDDALDALYKKYDKTPKLMLKQFVLKSKYYII
jgi:hypothetical protein